MYVCVLVKLKNYSQESKCSMHQTLKHYCNFCKTLEVSPRLEKNKIKTIFTSVLEFLSLK